MSVTLLQDHRKCNELEDDRKSCLHVLTWTALHFTNHTISGGSASRFLGAFDEEYEDKQDVKGGDLKMEFLVAHEIPYMVKFDCQPQLDALVGELTETFSVCYKEPPSAKDLQVLEDVWVANVPESVMTNLLALYDQKHLDDLASPSWFVDTFCHHLDVNIWPLSDEAQG